ncbi:MAG: ADP-forming succinate--CoA ligase subunit beta [Candidatus Bathyarchaeia archaeon]
MRLFEYEAKEIFQKFGVPVPKGLTAKSPEEAALAAKNIGLPVAIKAQVLVGGRGKAGGIKFANSLEEVIKKAEETINSNIRGHTVKTVLVEEKLEVECEYYLGVTIDQSSGCPTVMFSTEGGVDIEEISKEKPEAIVSRKVSVNRGFFEFESISMCKRLGLRDSALLKVGGILYKLYKIFEKCDAMIVEINPLVMTKNGEFYAADAKIEIDDDALFRQTDLKIDQEARIEDKMKAEAKNIGVSYVMLDGNIGVIGSGAGLTMATIDLINDFGGKPADFLETGGGITDQLMFNAVKLLLQDKRLKALFINLYGGINPMVLAAKGIVRACQELKVQIPVLVKLIGNEQEQAWEILESAGIPVVKSIRTEEGIEQLMKIIGEQ